MQTLEWSLPEYEEKDRSTDWFWTLGIITVTSSAAAFIFGNYFFGILLLLAGTLLGVFAKKKPRIILYKLNDKGLQIADRLYPFENIKTFWINTDLENNSANQPIFLIKVERLFMPIISMPIESDLAEKIRYSMLSKNIEEKEIKENPSEKIMESLGF